MKIPHSPHHWIPVALVLAMALFTLTEAWGQHTGSAAVFEGRPAMAGAQAGTGAMAGPPQGGIGVQGSDEAQIAVTRNPRTVTTPRTNIMGAGAAKPALPPASGVLPSRDDKAVPRDRDTGYAKDEKSTTKKVRKSAKRVRERAKHGVGGIDMEKAGS